MRITYDPDADAAYIYVVDRIAPGEATTQRMVGDDHTFALDFDSAGKLLGVEVLATRRNLRAEVLRGAERR